MATSCTIPEGYEQAEDQFYYKETTIKSLTYQEAVKQCAESGARIPVANSAEQLEIIKRLYAKSDIGGFDISFS